MKRTPTRVCVIDRVCSLDTPVPLLQKKMSKNNLEKIFTPDYSIILSQREKNCRLISDSQRRMSAPSECAIKLDFQTQVNLIRLHLASDKYVINPESIYTMRWDALVICALVFTATITPYEVILLGSSLNFLFVINIFVDCIFFIDMLINMHMSYIEQSDSDVAGIWIKDLRRIRKRYFKGWFWIDLLSILPFDVLGLSSKHSTMSKLRIFRIVRLLRLLKMFRILKLARISKQLENTISVSFSVQSLVKFICIILFGGHWLACLWCLVGMLSLENRESNWISQHYDSIDIFTASKIPFTIYTAALYFSVMTIATIGYGDIVPVNNAERWVCIFIMVAGSSFWAYVLGNASGIVATMNVEAIQYHRTMDYLNIFLKDQHADKALTKQMRGFFRAFRQLKRTFRGRELIQELSPNLRNEVLLKNVQWTNKVSWLQTASPQFIALLAQSMDGALFCPNEIMPSMNHLCIVRRGVVSKQGKVLLKGGLYGEDFVLHASFLKHKTPARALTFTELMFIKRAQLMLILMKFPIEARLVRKFAHKLALRRAIMLIYAFSKCGWKFGSDTHIPYVGSTSINKEIGKQYEKFVHKLHPQLSLAYATEKEDVQTLISNVEEKEKADNEFCLLLGNSVGKTNPTYTMTQGIDVESKVVEVETKLEELSKHIQNLEETVLNIAKLTEIKKPTSKLSHTNSMGSMHLDSPSSGRIRFIDNNKVVFRYLSSQESVEQLEPHFEEQLSLLNKSSSKKLFIPKKRTRIKDGFG